MVQPSMSELAAKQTPPATRMGALTQPLSQLEGSRWLIVADEVVTLDFLATRLRALGAVARLVDPSGSELTRLGAFDAQILLSRPSVDLRFLHERLTLHPGLRWATPLVLGCPEAWTTNDHAFVALAERAEGLLSFDRELLQLAKRPPQVFRAPVERLGPVRVLRALCAAQEVFRVRFFSDDHDGCVQIAGELLLGASLEQRGEPPLVGTEALACILELTKGRAEVEHRPALPDAPLSLSLDVALEQAYAELRERRASADADSPTLRLRSPFAQLHREEGERDSDPQPDPAEPVHHTKTASGIVRREDLRKTSPHQTGRVRDTAITEPMVVEPPRSRSGKLFVLLAALAVLASSVYLVRNVRRALAPASAQHKSPISTGAHDKSLRERSAATRAEVRRAALDATPPPAGETPTHSTSRERPEAPRAAASLVTPSPRTAPEVPATPAARPTPDSHDLARASERALATGDPARAVELAREALKLRPRRLRYMLLLAEALSAAGQRDAAVAHYRMALERKPDSPAILSRLRSLEAP
jgi:hypothetical protein